MQKSIQFIFLIGLLTGFSGCFTKKISRQAVDLEMAGMYRQAAEIYYQAAMRRPNNVDFKTGLRRASLMYMEDVTQEIQRSYNRGEYQRVVYDYLGLVEFTKKVRATGVDIQIDPMAAGLYNNAQLQYLDERYEEGLRFMNEQRYSEARTVFTEISRINPDFKDTRSLLNTATMEPLYQRGTELYNQRNFMAAYNEWKKITDRDPNYKDTRQRMQQALNERYREGTIFLMNEDFTNAAIALGDVFKANPTYMDVRALYFEARNEPIYRRATESLRQGRCRSAYFDFTQILSDVGGDYRDASNLRSQALECAAFPIAVHSNAMPSHSADGTEFEKALIQGILSRNDPFIKIHTLPSVSRNVHRSLQGTVTNPNRAQLRELHDRHGIKALLIVNYTQYERSEGSLQRTERNGFVRETTTNQQGVMSHHDKPVKYNEFTRKNNVSLSLSYQLISTANGEILLTNRINHSESSEINYAVFEGETRHLYPAVLRNNNWVIDERNFSSLQRLFSAEREISPVPKLRENVFMNLTGRMTDAIVKFNPERN